MPHLKREIDGAPAGTEVTVISDTDENGVWTGDPNFACGAEVELPDGSTMIVAQEDLDPE